MKHKKFLKRKALLLFIGLITLWNCQNDDSYNSRSIQNNQNYKIIKLNFSDLEKMSGVLEKLQEVQLKSQKDGIQHKSTAQIEGFEVDTDNVLMLESNGKHSFNFEIIEQENEKHRNLVLNQENDNSYSAYVVEYDLTPQEKNTLREGGVTNINGKASLVLKDEGGEKIVAVSELVVNNDNGFDIQISIFSNGTLVARGRKRCECEGEYQGGGGNPIIIGGGSFDFSGIHWGWGPATPVDLGITLPGSSGGGDNQNPVIVTPVVSDFDSIEELNKISNYNNLGINQIRDKLNEYRLEFNIPFESGYEYRPPGNGYTSRPAANNIKVGVKFENVSIFFNSVTRAHKHHNGLEPVMSAEDILGMVDFYNQKKAVNNNPQNDDGLLNNITSIMISKTGLHALRVNNDSEEFSNSYAHLANKKGLEAKYTLDVRKEAMEKCNCTEGDYYEELLFQYFIQFMKDWGWGFDYYYAPFPDDPDNDDFIWEKMN